MNKISELYNQSEEDRSHEWEKSDIFWLSEKLVKIKEERNKKIESQVIGRIIERSSKLALRILESQGFVGDEVFFEEFIKDPNTFSHYSTWNLSYSEEEKIHEIQEEFLQKIKNIQEKVEENKKEGSLGFSINIWGQWKGKKKNKEWSSEREGEKKEIKLVNKKEILEESLKDLGLESSQYSFYKEKNEEREERESYVLCEIRIDGKEIFILSCDQIGFSTYFYNASLSYLDLKFLNTKQRKEKFGHLSQKYCPGYKEKIKTILQSLLCDCKTTDKGDKDISQDVVKLLGWEKQVFMYQKFVYGMQNLLEEEADIYCENETWYMRNARGSKKWKSLTSFPNWRFNQYFGIGSDEGVLRNRKDLAKAFKRIWMNVATLGEEKIFWKKRIEEQMIKNKWKLNISSMNNEWDLRSIKNIKEYITFPKKVLLKEFGIEYDNRSELYEKRIFIFVLKTLGIIYKYN